MMYSIPTVPKLRVRIARWAPSVLFSITLCSLIAHQIGLSGLTQRLDELADSTDLPHLADQVMMLEKSFASMSPPKEGVSYSQLNELNDSFNERITELATAMTVVVSRTDLDALMQRVQQIELKQAQMNTPIPPVLRQKKPHRSKKATEIPLQILGQELRGEEHFLSVGPLHAQSLEQCQLVRVGETYAGWKLDRIDGETAVFTSEGETHRLEIR